MNKKFFVFFLLLIGGGAGILFFNSHQKPEKIDVQAEALGLRGESKISKNLSHTQLNRLETHFLEVPPSVQAESHPHKPSVVSTINQVQSINKFNSSQRP